MAVGSKGGRRQCADVVVDGCYGANVVFGVAMVEDACDAPSKAWRIDGGERGVAVRHI